MKRESRLPLSKCKNLIENADVLLFRHPEFPKLGWFVARYTLNQYSHVALASIDNVINCVEFREFRGSRIFPLEAYIETGHIIDVYRMSHQLLVPYLDAPPVVNGHKAEISYEELSFTDDIKDAIVNEAKKLIGRNYGYINIAKILLTLLPFIRLVTHKDTIEKTPKHFVCSTMVEFCYRKHWLELVPNINDSFVSPADIAGSSLLNYLFTINEI
jgi:hypothetical protein